MSGPAAGATAAAIEARQRANGCNQDDEAADWGRACCDGCLCLAEAKAALLSGNEAVTLAVGMSVRDNDPRAENRILVIHAIENDKAVLRHPRLPGKTFETRISVNRIHLDSKPRRSGWSVVNV